MGEISSASSDQTHGIEQINQAMVQMDQGHPVQRHALVEEAAAAAQSLERQAQALVQTVSVFRLEGDGNGGRRPAAAPARSTHAPCLRLEAWRRPLFLFHHFQEPHAWRTLNGPRTW